MGYFTNYLEKKVIDHCLKTTAYNPPGPIYLGLFSATPNYAGGGTEVIYTNYARQPIYFGTAAARSIAQSGIVTFPQCGATGDTAAYWGLFDALTSGNLLAYGSLSASQGIVSGNTPSVASGQVTVSFNAGVIFTTIADTILAWLFAGSWTIAYSGGTGSQPSPGATVTGNSSGATATLISVTGTWASSGTLYLAGKSGAFTNGEQLNITGGVHCTNAQGTPYDAVSTLAQATNVKAGLSTSTPTDAGGNITEPSNGYAQVSFNTWNAASPVSNVETATNNGAIVFSPGPTGSWGTITYGILYLDTTPFVYAAVTNQSPQNGDTVEWLTTAFTISLQ